MQMRWIEEALIFLQGAQVIFLLLHDWLPLGHLSNLQAIRTLDTRSRRLWTTALSTLPFALGLAFSITHFPVWPGWLRIWLEWMYTLTIVSVLFAWWIPYFSPNDSERAERYRTRFAGTYTFLPKRHGFSPDALHTVYHATILLTVLLLTAL